MGKSIVLTGAGGFLGEALARAFVKDGHTVFLLGRTLSKLEAVASKIGAGAIPVACDIADGASVTAAFGAIKAASPKIDVLINNAGIYELVQLTEASDEKVAQIIMINLVGAVNCTKAVIPLMDRGASILNVTSGSVDWNYPGMTLYQTAKAGMERFSLSMKEELRASGIRVTVVRAGTMSNQERLASLPPGAVEHHMNSLKAAGIDPVANGFTDFESMPSVFRFLIDLPQDLEVGLISLGSRVP